MSAGEATAVPAAASFEAAVSPWRLRWRRFLRHRPGVLALATLLALVLLCLAATPLQALLGIDPDATDLLSRYDPPSAAHWLGTDDAGRDELLRLMVGGQISLLVGLFATLAGDVMGQHAEQRAGTGDDGPGARGLPRVDDFHHRDRSELLGRRPAARLRPTLGALGRTCANCLVHKSLANCSI